MGYSEPLEEYDEFCCNTELPDGTYCGLYAVSMFVDIKSNRCRHHIYLDGKEVAQEYEKLTN